MNTCKFQKIVAVLFALLLLQGCSQTSHNHAINPAYRPHSEYAAEFVKALKNSTMAVYPSIIRTLEGTTYSVSSQRQVVSLLNQQQVTTAVASPGPIDPGQLKGPPQWDIFVHDMHSIAENLKSKQSEPQYSLVMEIIFPPGNQSVWGIHCFIFDNLGNNAFWCLLNSHHRLFIDAGLSSTDASEASRARLVEKATQVGVTALIHQVNTPVQEEALKHQGYSITSQKIATFDKKVDKIFVITRLQKQLMHIFMHSFKHSLVSGFESNGVKAIVKLMPRDSNDFAQFESELERFLPDAVMYIDLDPLYSTRKDGQQAVVGTDFAVSVINRASEAAVWQAKGKVDYIQDRYFNRGSYTAHEGIRKEFAWHTTAAIVRTFMPDVNGHPSAPIYTVTEDRQLHGQRTD